uniref:SWIM-type domain-containing protein n=1 Tax=Ixodes ricinus TaxID=34613 RepID=A0A6B0V768_IXORI
MWRNDLEALPVLSYDTFANLCASTATSSCQQSNEPHTLPSSVSTNACDSSLGIVYARATCYGSQKKTGPSHKVLLAFELDSGAVAGAACACPAGTSNTCSHILATLRLLVLLKRKGFEEAPPELSCTELPRQGKCPRREGARPSVQDAEWGSPCESGVPVPVPVRFLDARARREEEQRQLDSFHKLGESLKRLGNHQFAAVLLAAKGPFVETKFGLAHVGSPLSYQQATLPLGFQTQVSPDVSTGSGTLGTVPEAFLSDGASPRAFADTFNVGE